MQKLRQWVAVAVICASTLPSLSASHMATKQNSRYGHRLPDSDTLNLNSQVQETINREMMFLESIKQNLVDRDSIHHYSAKSPSPPPLDDNTPISNEALSNLAFLDLSNLEKHTLEAKYKALSGQETNQA